MSCNDCQTVDDLIRVEVSNCCEDSDEEIVWIICRKCLTAKNLYCCEHRMPKELIFDPAVTGWSGEHGEMPLLTYCTECCFAKARELPLEEAKEYILLLKENDPEMLKGYEELACQYEAGRLLVYERRVAFGLFMTAEIHNRTIGETVTEFVMIASGQGIVRN